MLARADVDVGALRAEIRAAVHDELAARTTGADSGEPAGGAAAPVDGPDQAPTEEQTAAAERARAMADDVLSRGRITADDAMAMREVLDQAAPADAMEVRLALARAVNAQQLRPDGPHAMP